MTNNTTQKSVTPAQLRLSIEDISSYAQSSLSEIASIAKLSLLALEQPASPKFTECVANALHVIWAKCEQAENIINNELEEVGFNFQNTELGELA